VHVIDVNASFGKRVDPDPRYSSTALLEKMGRHQVACALAYSQQAVEYDARAGNGEAISLARANRRILPVGVLDLKETPRWQDELARCLNSGVRVFRFFPREQAWTLDSASFRQVLRALRGSGACLVFGETRWQTSDLVARLTAGLGLPVILADLCYDAISEAIAVMQEHPHVYAETNWLATVGAVNVMVHAVGAGRLLYGSGAPAHPMQKALNQVLEADLADGDKAAILGGNAATLLGIWPEQLAGCPELAQLDPGRFDEEIVDVHTHLGHWRLSIPDEGYNPDGMLRRMAQYGVSASIVSSYESMRYDVAAGNRNLARAFEGHPELMGYVELDPYHLELSCQEMDCYYRLSNFVGCELELTHIPCPTGSPQVRALLAEVAQRGRPVLLKTASNADAHVERELAREHPHLVVIHAHGADASWARIVRDAPNVCVEFCLGRPFHHDLRDCLDILGPERVLFGTDQTLFSVGAAVGLYLDARMSAVERRQVLSANARRIFGLPGG
jgi:hypothetical protein